MSYIKFTDIAAILRLPAPIYIAAPYRALDYPGAESRVQAWRASVIADITLQLLQQGISVLSPVPLGWLLEQRIIKGDTDVPDWLEHLAFPMLAAAQSMVVLTLAGWNKSVGVTKELARAKSLDLPVIYARVYGVSCEPGEVEE